MLSLFILVTTFFGGVSQAAPARHSHFLLRRLFEKPNTILDITPDGSGSWWNELLQENGISPVELTQNPSVESLLSTPTYSGYTSQETSNSVEPTSKEQQPEEGQKVTATASSHASLETSDSVEPTSKDLTQEQLDTILSIHNQVRGTHGVANLTWSSELANFAAQHSQECVFAHTQSNNYGENLAYGYPNVHNAVYAWYNEVDQYRWQDPTFAESTGHFTQMIWKDTTQVGCGLCACGGSVTNLLTCEYFPAGNVVGTGPDGKSYFQLNVFPPSN